MAMQEQQAASIGAARVLLDYDDADLAILGVKVISGTQAIRVRVNTLAGALLLTHDFAANTNATFAIARAAGIHMLVDSSGELGAPYQVNIGEI
jgi:hypothetical protein